MLTAVAHNELVIAKDVCKDDGPFLCLECSAPLQVKKGAMKAHHFAHLVDAGCRCGYGEGERHRQLKEEICAVLTSSPLVRGLQQERRELKLAYPDISFLFQGKGWIAVEVQVTDISVDTIQRRVQAYTERGIVLLWVLPGRRISLMATATDQPAGNGICTRFIEASSSTGHQSSGYSQCP